MSKTDDVAPGVHVSKIKMIPSYIQRIFQYSGVRFLFGGGVTVLCEYVVFYLLYVLVHWNLLLSNSLSFGAGLAVSYMFNRLWAFKKPSYRRKAHHQMVLYVLLAVTNLVFNNVIVSGLHGLGLDPRIGKIIAIIVIAAWNFVIYHKVIFIEA